MQAHHRHLPHSLDGGGSIGVCGQPVSWSALAGSVLLSAMGTVAFSCIWASLTSWVRPVCLLLRGEPEEPRVPYLAALFQRMFFFFPPDGVSGAQHLLNLPGMW